MITTRFFKQVFLIVVLLFGFSLSTSWAKEPQLDKLDHFKGLKILKVSPKMPPSDLNIPDTDGAMVKLSDYTGKLVFINFWASWCRECVDEMPAIEKLHRQFLKKDLVVIGINLEDDKAQIDWFYKRLELSFKTAMDKSGDIGRAFFIRAIPTSMIINKKGQIIGVAYGSRAWDSKESFAFFRFLGHLCCGTT